MKTQIFSGCNKASIGTLKDQSCHRISGTSCQEGGCGTVWGRGIRKEGNYFDEALFVRAVSQGGVCADLKHRKSFLQCLFTFQVLAMINITLSRKKQVNQNSVHFFNSFFSLPYEITYQVIDNISEVNLQQLSPAFHEPFRPEREDNWSILIFFAHSEPGAKSYTSYETDAM